MFPFFGRRVKPSDLGGQLAHTALAAVSNMVKEDVREMHALRIGISAGDLHRDLIHLSIACHEIAIREACREESVRDAVLASFDAKVTEIVEARMRPDVAQAFMTPLGWHTKLYRRAYAEGVRDGTGRVLGDTFSTVCGDHDFTLAALVELTFGTLIQQVIDMVREELQA